MIPTHLHIDGRWQPSAAGGTCWAQWLCDTDRYEHRYVQGTSFFVVKGQARLALAGGTTLDIENGDFLSIGKGAEAVWDISTAAETRYSCRTDVNPIAASKCPAY